jgi:type IV secretion system protein VirD4
MFEDKQKLLISISIILAVCLASYVSSIVFFFLSKYPVSDALPWSVWTFLPYAGDPQIQSRLFVALGFPFLGAATAFVKIFNPSESSLGDARWATQNDIRKAGLNSSKGILLGKYRSRYLYSDTNTHVMCVAPTRSGKGIGVVIPNLLSWEDSVVCFDIKQENFEKTAGFRKAHGHKVFLWAPLSKDRKSHRYNPFSEISSDPITRISDLQRIATILIKDSASHDSNMWIIEARSLFVGLALYVLDNDEMPSTIGSVYRLLGTEQELGDIIRHIVKTHRELDPESIGMLMNFANKAAKERSGVKSSLSQALSLWKTPEIDAVTEESDFFLRDLKKKRMAVYIGVATGDIPTVAPLLNLFFEQLMTTLTMKMPDESEPRKVLILLDEFHMLGRMETVANVFTLAGGYNCRVLAVVQGLGWIDDVYGKQKRDGILSVCAHRIFFAANDLETARYVSEMCGEKTVQSVSTTRNSSSRFGSSTKNTSMRTWPLITKDQVTRLSRKTEIILAEANFPIKCQKVAYNMGSDAKIFGNRVMTAPPTPTLHIERHDIPRFDIPKNDNQEEELYPNQGNLFKENRNATPDDLVDQKNEDNNTTGKKEKEDNKAPGLFFDKDDNYPD